MNQDLKPFYETAHQVYLELQKADNVPFNTLFKPNILHESQFLSLLNVLVKMGLAINRLS